MTRRHPALQDRHPRTQPNDTTPPHSPRYAPENTPRTGKAITLTEARKRLARSYGSWPPIGRKGWTRHWRTECDPSEYPDDSDSLAIAQVKITREANTQLTAALERLRIPVP